MLRSVAGGAARQEALPCLGQGCHRRRATRCCVLRARTVVLAQPFAFPLAFLLLLCLALLLSTQKQHCGVQEETGACQSHSPFGNLAVSCYFPMLRAYIIHEPFREETWKGDAKHAFHGLQAAQRTPALRPGAHRQPRCPRLGHAPASWPAAPSRSPALPHAMLSQAEGAPFYPKA